MKKPCHLRNASRNRKNNIDSICCHGDLLPWIFQNWSMHLRGIFKVHFKCIKDGWRCNFLVWLKKLHNFDKNWAAPRISEYITYTDGLYTIYYILMDYILTHRISEYMTYTDGLRKEIYRCPNSRQYLLRRKRNTEDELWKNKISQHKGDSSSS